jgi:hypothetical protein
MEVGFHANITDGATTKVAGSLHPVFESLSHRLRGEYGGMMEHLWIDIELVESHSRSDGKSKFPFRFQKRVSGRSPFGIGEPIPDSFNVGHFSVRPDFQILTSLLPNRAIPYVLSLIYEASSVLLEKQKKLGGFNANLFRQRFLEECKGMGYEIPLAEAIIEEWLVEAWVENS